MPPPAINYFEARGWMRMPAATATLATAADTCSRARCPDCDLSVGFFFSLARAHAHAAAAALAS